MARILMHPKNKDQKGSKKHIELNKAYETYKSKYQVYFFLFLSSALTNVFLLLILGHHVMSK